MTKKEKIRRPKARLPKGFRDRLGADITQEREMLQRVGAVYQAWGFDPLETPALEYTDALGKFLPDVERPNAGVFSLQDEDQQWMSLRYDLTAPLARFVAEYYDALPKPFRRYAVGQVWRNEKPGPGRYRQFTQMDADSVGAPAPHADVECVAMLAAAIDAALAPLRENGVTDAGYVIRFNDRNVLTGLLSAIDIDEDRDTEKKLSVLRAMDKLDRLGDDGVRRLLGPGRKDESGDFTEGAHLPDDAIDRVMNFMAATATTNAETCNRLADLIGGSSAGAQGVATLSTMSAQLTAMGLDETRAVIDLSVIRGLEYYTGPVFEGELTGVLKDAKGRPVRIGSIASGGRYDGLIKRFKGVEVPAVGVSVGVSRLLTALDLMKDGQATDRGPVIVLALEKDQMANYHMMAAELRRAGVRAEVYMGGSNFAKQLKYADKRNAPIAVIQGEDEREKGEVTVKDLVRGAKMSAEIKDNTEWREGQRAQVTIPRAQMIDAVKAALNQ